jgi:hypothetical protein
MAWGNWMISGDVVRGGNRGRLLAGTALIDLD